MVIERVLFEREQRQGRDAVRAVIFWSALARLSRRSYLRFLLGVQDLRGLLGEVFHMAQLIDDVRGATLRRGDRTDAMLVESMILDNAPILRQK
jgi:hypothetical protein